MEGQCMLSSAEYLWTSIGNFMETGIRLRSLNLHAFSSFKLLFSLPNTTALLRLCFQHDEKAEYADCGVNNEVYVEGSFQEWNYSARDALWLVASRSASQKNGNYSRTLKLNPAPVR